MNSTHASPPPDLRLPQLAAAYRDGTTTPTRCVNAMWERWSDPAMRAVWISLRPREALRAEAAELERRGPHGLPLYGVPFAVKDNIDLAGTPTTAGCPAFAYTPSASAPVVQRLVDAGAIPVGKTNLDQFATGLVGVRSPYGTPPNPFGPEWIPGGSSSGSAVAVASGLASFALGTDTAGSGRVPAAFNHIVGLKPTRGWWSTRGVVPACRSLDCVSVFALTTADAWAVAEILGSFDPADPWARPATAAGRGLGPTFVFATPPPDQLEWFGDTEAPALFEAALAQLESVGGQRREIDYTPFLETAQLLYGGPWIAERVAAFGAFAEQNPEALHPVTRHIVAGGTGKTAAEVFAAIDRLAALRAASEKVWADGADCLCTPTAAFLPTRAAVEADPLNLNAHLGRYTNHMNLLDHCGLALPAGFRRDGSPFGITLSAPAFHDRWLAVAGARYQAALGGTLGATGIPADLAPDLPEESPRATEVAVAVCGAHMTGLPLNGQLLDAGGRFWRHARSARGYRFFHLPGDGIPRPALVRDPDGPGDIALEIWCVDRRRFGDFVAGVRPPLAIGPVDLDDGTRLPGFVGDASAAAGAKEITECGGWRNYLATPTRA